MTGVLLINLGTPDTPSVEAVRRYLREFLNDPMVIDISPVARWMLLNLLILPTRPKQSAAAYQKVWLEAGSPLRVYSDALKDSLQATLGQGYTVELGMRYGNPSINSALTRLDDACVDRIVVVPLYPQYAMSSTGTALASLYEDAASRPIVPSLQVIPDFYDHPGYLDAASKRLEKERDEFKPDHIFFSYHGLPERHVKKADRSGQHCLASSDCCDQIVLANRSCYRAQCMATTRGLVERLGLEQDDYTVGFQSRLGRTPWIKPYTDELLPALVERGVRRVLVSCPSFVSDCLETLEEIGIRAREDFIAAGGDDLRLVPCLNSDQAWTNTVAAMVQSATP
jgi:protoporphyrin/coproporphyrin ferrochelatase